MRVYCVFVILFLIFDPDRTSGLSYPLKTAHCIPFLNSLSLNETLNYFKDDHI
jgi:hypothetical protein